LGLACALTFAVSTAFPVVASLMNVAEMPRVLGIVDVVRAAVLVATALAMQGRAAALVRDVDSFLRRKTKDV
jgi:phosphosulfolactate phosphohydrolase-like enzyme